MGAYPNLGAIGRYMAITQGDEVTDETIEVTIRPVGPLIRRIGRFYYAFDAEVPGIGLERFEVIFPMDRRQARRMARRLDRRFIYYSREDIRWRPMDPLDKYQHEVK